jgi:hypothetical protein
MKLLYFCHTYVINCGHMPRTGRPTLDPKGAVLTIRVAERDVAVLKEAARRDGVTVGEAARRSIRKALGIPGAPSKAAASKQKKSTRRSKP